jgi:predicted permease
MRDWLAELGMRMRHFRDDRDLKDELRAHIEMLAEDDLASGLSRDEASRRARAKLGDADVVIEKIRDQEFATLVESWFRDFVLAVRILRKSPLFCLTAILTLAVGIGANTAVFTLLYGLLLRSLPVSDPHRLARIKMYGPTQPAALVSQIPYRMVEQFRKEQRSFTEISTWLSDRIALEDTDGAQRFQAVDMVSGNAFDVLQMKPYLGRLIIRSDDVRGGPATGWPVVLSYGLWQERFGEDARIIGKAIRLADTMATVVGVTPPEFHGLSPGMDARLYVPIHFYLTFSDQRPDLDSPATLVRCMALARLRPGVSLEQANAEVAVHKNELLQLVPAKWQQLPVFRDAAFRVESARTGFPSLFSRTYSQPLYLMQGLVGVVLLLCCVNLGGLMMSRLYTRRHEFAVRTAIGASPRRILRQFLIESFVLAAAGAALGAALGWRGNDFLLQFFRTPMIGQWMSVHPDRTVLSVTFLLAVLTTLFFGTWPAWRASRTDPGALLTSRTPGTRSRAAGRAFIPVQVGLSVALVTIAVLLSQSVARLRSEHTGFDLRHVTIQTAPFNLLAREGDARLDLYQKMVDRIEQMPGIESAAVTWQTPMTGLESTASFQAMFGTNSPQDFHMAYNNVGPGYFKTMKTRIVAGREFRKNEREANVCIVNESAARSLFPHEKSIGSYVRSHDEKEIPEALTCRIVGVAEDAKFGDLRESPPPTIYFPLTRNTIPKGNLVFLINSVTKIQAITGYRKALSEIAPTVPLVIFATLEEQMDAALGSERLVTAMSDFFGSLALLLSAIGLYGLLAASVARRTSEIGVRIALGAERRSVLWMILFDALRLAGEGVLLGGAMLFLGSRFIRNMLYGVSAFDPLTLSATVAVLLVVALAASLIPAMRAASIDPIQALRAE